MSISYSNSAMEALCSNLSKACEKQFRTREAGLFKDLALYYKKKAGLPESSSMKDIEALNAQQLQELYQKAEAAASGAEDRGAKRALVWGKKVTTIHKSLLKRVASASPESLEKQNYYVCEACGFIALAEDVPERCPICKAPSLRFTKVA
jgi:rubrerythrin